MLIDRGSARRGSTRARPLALAGLLLIAASAVAATHRQTTESAGSDIELLVATVRRVDAEGSVLEVIRGVGLALRSVSMQVAPACRIQASGRAAGLTDVRTGTVVRVGCRKVGDSLVAESIEIVPAEAGARP